MNLKEQANEQQAGAVISARNLSAMARAANRSGNVMGSAGAGTQLENMQGDAKAPPVVIRMLRAKFDILPRNYDAAELDYIRDEDNCTMQLWNDVTGDWGDQDGRDCSAIATGTPLLENEVFPAILHGPSGLWVPLEHQVTSMVEIYSDIKHGDGLYDGYTIHWENDDFVWMRNRLVYILDANDQSFPIETADDVEFPPPTGS
jgi:hypothetical protein